MSKISFLILILGFISCQGKNEPLLNNDATSITETISIREDLNKNGLEIESEIITAIEQEIGKQCESLNREVWKYGKDDNEEHYLLDTGLIFKFVAENRAHQIFEKYHAKVRESGNYLFLTHLDFDASFNSYFDIIIINCNDPFEVINLIGTEGLNYDIYNDQVINKLKEWDTLVGFNFEVVDGARIQAYMNKLPTNIEKFATEVYAFCPDVIDQGYGSMEEMISDYQQNKYFWLWWD